uniref:ETS domain-containing protein n=1 Tax=Ascaris lumbricoides TaxID=6252 RepID=A0A0M3HYA5_ASCLU
MRQSPALCAIMRRNHNIKPSDIRSKQSGADEHKLERAVQSDRKLESGLIIEKLFDIFYKFLVVMYEMINRCTDHYLSVVEGLSRKGDVMGKRVRLWQFLIELLEDNAFKNVIQWICRPDCFKVLDDAELARLWGARKNNKEMSFLELCNEMRPYYARGLMFKFLGQRLIYHFGESLKAYVLKQQHFFDDDDSTKYIHRRAYHLELLQAWRSGTSPYARNSSTFTMKKFDREDATSNDSYSRSKEVPILRRSLSAETITKSSTSSVPWTCSKSSTKTQLRSADKRTIFTPIPMLMAREVRSSIAAALGIPKDSAVAESLIYFPENPTQEEAIMSAYVLSKLPSRAAAMQHCACGLTSYGNGQLRSSEHGREAAVSAYKRPAIIRPDALQMLYEQCLASDQKKLKLAKSG